MGDDAKLSSTRSFTMVFSLILAESTVPLFSGGGDFFGLKRLPSPESLMSGNLLLSSAL